MELLGIVALATCIPTVLIFGLIALWIAKKHSNEHSDSDTVYFLTARNTQSTSRIAWSFYAASIGTGAIFAPVAYSVDPERGAGIIGLLTYSCFTGLPIIMVAWMGGLIRKKYPDSQSLGQFANHRFGSVVEIFVTLLVFFNLSIAMAAEYTGIGELFSTILGVSALIPIITVGLVTLSYTLYGGLYVSIVTDQYQAIFSLFLLLITGIYIAITFRLESLPELPPYLAPNEAGYSSLITLSLALSTSCFYSDAMWQRVWSSENEKSLKKGAIIGALLTILVVFLFGFAGFMATWAGYSKDPNTAFLAILNAGNSSPPIWIAIIVSLFAITMNESAIDSYQNAITDTVVSMAMSFGMKINITTARIIVVLSNVPIMILGAQGYNIASIFLISNMTTTCCTLPVAFGLLDMFNKELTGSTVLFSSSFALFLVVLYGYITTGSLSLGIYTYFYDKYDAGAFLIGSVGSVVGVLIYIGVARLIRYTRVETTEECASESLISS